jgi:hypothetical protein
MLDLIFLFVTIAFFGIAVAYVKACDRLGKGSSGR